ncbi:outer membrane beta-barrel protein [Flavobacterium sp. Sd200]|uniref:porin family protein n=1 Tax=Flavobacterium sp. Sd200 TaxID=2692211 RepID=UPI00136BD76D|nr:porin family protein [Flavobacterium sp. Sd200]MXN91484.1 outer membrane beta-barrel protein [Flavobacterium sp. Sd200]
MKKNLIVFLSTLLPIIATSQETKTPNNIKFGVQAGVTYAGIRGNEKAKSNDYAIDFTAGISIEAPINEKFSILGNLNYEALSFTNTISLFSSNEWLPDPNDPSFREGILDTRFTLHYLNLPLNIKYYIGKNRLYYVNGGVFAGILLGETLRIDRTIVSDRSGSLYKDLNFGINLGIGTRIPVNSTNDINIELRNNLGLSNIGDVPTINGGSVRTNSVNLTVAWQFGL